MGISAVLLAYKEEENLKILLPKIKSELSKTGQDFEIIVIDTATPLDNTERVCKELGATYINQEEPHFGGAFRTGIRHAKMDKFLILDSDGSHNPKYISSIYEVFCTGADVVIGSRYIKGGETHAAALSKVMSFLLNTAFRIVLGIRAKDISTDYRMYHTEDLKKVNLICDNYDILQEVLLRLKIAKKEEAGAENLLIKEIPISFNKRLHGESKRRLLPFIISYIKTLCRLAAIRVRYTVQSDKGRLFFRQLLLYGIIGVLAAVIDLSVFIFLNRSIHWTNPILSNITASFIGFCFSFTCNTVFTFRKRDRWINRFLSYLFICVCGIALSSTIIYLLQNLINLTLLKITCIALIAFLQFLFNKMITFKN